MKKELEQLKSRLFFTVDEITHALGIRRQSAWVLCNRRVKTGQFIRLKQNFYVFAENWRSMNTEHFFSLANFIQAPSYISFLSALTYHEATTQVTQNYFESASLKRSANFDAEGIQFRYYKLKKDRYFGYEKKNNVFIATKEKALADAIYLYSFGKYKLDFSAIDMTKFNYGELRRILQRFPDKTFKTAKKLCKSL